MGDILDMDRIANELGAERGGKRSAWFGFPPKRLSGLTNSPSKCNRPPCNLRRSCLSGPCKLRWVKSLPTKPMAGTDERSKGPKDTRTIKQFGRPR